MKKLITAAVLLGTIVVSLNFVSFVFAVPSVNSCSSFNSPGFKFEGDWKDDTRGCRHQIPPESVEVGNVDVSFGGRIDYWNDIEKEGRPTLEGGMNVIFDTDIVTYPELGDEAILTKSGPPWNATSGDSSIELGIRLGDCDLYLDGFGLFVKAITGEHKADYNAVGEYMGKQVFAAADHIIESTGDTCGAKGVVIGRPDLKPTGVVEKNKLTEQTEDGVSSKDLRALLRAMNEFQYAQAELEKVKAANNPAWIAKKDFANMYKEALEDVPSETELRLKSLRKKLEYIKDAAGAYQDIDDFSNYLQGKGFEASSRAGKVAEVGEGIITFLDLMNEGASFENAATKAAIDTIAPNMFYIFPPLKAADLVATLPDDIMGAIGIPKDHWSRTTTGYLAKNSPTAFVETTTSAMVKTDTWTNVGGAFQVAWDDLKSAEGLGGKAEATLGLVGTTVGAIPVAIAMRTRDQVVTAVEVFKLGAKGAGSFVSSLFTWPN